MSDFHSIAPYGSKVCHGSVTGVTDPSQYHGAPEEKQGMPHSCF